MLDTGEQQEIRDRAKGIVAAWQEDQRGPIESLTLDGYIDLVEAAALAADEGNASLRLWVSAARRAGASWEQVGVALGVSRQAAQRRFAATADEPENSTAKRVRGMNAFNEVSRMTAEGADGYELVGGGFLYLDFRFVGQPVENIRVASTRSTRTIGEMEDEGWTHQFSWPPFNYFSRHLPE